MNKPPLHEHEKAFVSQVSDLSRSDRWFIYHRLQSLNIPCWCPQDGSLLVQIEYGIHAILLRSIVQHFNASRLENLNWLERCWDTVDQGFYHHSPCD